MNTRRPLPVAIAAALIALHSLVNLLPASVFGLSTEGPPAFIIYLSIAFGAMGLVAAGGLWMLKSWGMWLAIAVCALNILAAAPGLVFAPTPAWQAAAVAGVAGPALIVLLVALPNSRRAYA